VQAAPSGVVGLPSPPAVGAVFVLPPGDSPMAISTPPSAPMTLAQKAKRELTKYLIISAYLYVCLGALIFYKTALLRSEGILFASFGLAAAKALILGKFILLAETFKFGDRFRSERAALQIGIKSLLFALLLVVLSFIEEVIVGYVHGRKALDVALTFGGGTLPQLLATTLLMVLIMVPYFAFGEIAATMEEGEFARLLMERNSRENGRA
jgi:hypothetical protein